MGTVAVARPWPLMPARTRKRPAAEPRPAPADREVLAQGGPCDPEVGTPRRRRTPTSTRAAAEHRLAPADREGGRDAVLEHDTTRPLWTSGPSVAPRAHPYGSVCVDCLFYTARIVDVAAAQAHARHCSRASRTGNRGQQFRSG